MGSSMIDEGCRRRGTSRLVFMASFWALLHFSAFELPWLAEATQTAMTRSPGTTVAIRSVARSSFPVASLSRMTSAVVPAQMVSTIGSAYPEHSK